MKRFHVHVSVNDLPRSIRFYSTIFGTSPTVEKGDYAKWMLEDPRINFAISERGDTPGVNHLGLQVDDADELVALRERIGRADIAADDEPAAQCCYALSDKYWVEDPQGVAWETFHTLGDMPLFGKDRANVPAQASACCAPAAAAPVAAAPAKCCAPAATIA